MKNLKTKNPGKSEAKERIVLVATYKGDQLTKWPGWYNYPIKDGDKISVDDAATLVASHDDPNVINDDNDREAA